MAIFNSNGKVLLTGEYAVLDGAVALALPSKKGQSMEVQDTEKSKITWLNLDMNEKLWYQAEFEIKEEGIIPSENKFYLQDAEVKAVNQRLEQILNEAFSLNRTAFIDKGFRITNRLNFNRQWGLGTSSTLINNLAQWLKIDPYLLLKNTFGGSGYDIAAASSDQPILYQITEHGPETFKVLFDPSFKEQLFFVYLNRKQNSREAIAHYHNRPKGDVNELNQKISGITNQLLKSESLEEFRLMIETHESLISKAINLPKIKQQLFSDFKGSIKSLGGWGGDFILAIGGKEERDYFRSKGYKIIFEYAELIK